MTVGDVVRSALLKLGVIDKFSEPAANDYADGIQALNVLLKRLGIDRLGIHTQAVVTHTLTPSDGSYTIGATGDIVTARPNKILSAQVIDGNTEYTLAAINAVEYAQIYDKTITGVPEKIYFNATATNGTIKLWPLPSAAYTLSLTLQQPLTEYTVTSTTLTLPDEYLAHLAWGLAVDLAPEYNVQPSQVVLVRAEETLAALKRAHSSSPRAFTDPIRSNTGEYNILGDSWS